MCTVTTFKIWDLYRRRANTPVYLHLLTSSGHVWNSVLIVLSPAIWWRSLELPSVSKEILLKLLLDYILLFHPLSQLIIRFDSPCSVGPHLVLRLKMSEAIRLLPPYAFTVWTGKPLLRVLFHLQQN